MAVTEEFVEQVSQALDQLGYSVEQEEDVIDDVSQLNDDVTLPGIRVSNGTMTGYVSMKLAVLRAYLDTVVSAIQTQWNTWFGLDDTTDGGVQKIWKTWFTGRQSEWDVLKPEINERITTADSDHTRADTDHQTATQDHTTASSDHTQAGKDHSTATQDHQTSVTQSAYAKDQGDYAKNMAEHPAYVGDDDYWYLWNYATQAYVKGPYAKGDDLDFSTMTAEEIQRLVDNIKDSIVFATVQTCEDIIDEL
jgi:hypothetical protein